MRKIVFGTVAALTTLLALPSYADGIGATWMGWNQTVFSSYSECAEGSYNFLKEQPELFEAGREGLAAWANLRSEAGSVFIFCAPNGEATLFASGTSDNAAWVQQLTNKYKRAVGQ